MKRLKTSQFNPTHVKSSALLPKFGSRRHGLKSVDYGPNVRQVCWSGLSLLSDPQLMTSWSKFLILEWWKLSHKDSSTTAVMSGAVNWTVLFTAMVDILQHVYDAVDFAHCDIPERIKLNNVANVTNKVCHSNSSQITILAYRNAIPMWLNLFVLPCKNYSLNMKSQHHKQIWKFNRNTNQCWLYTLTTRD
jgi:hypothetical protein